MTKTRITELVTAANFCAPSAPAPPPPPALEGYEFGGLVAQGGQATVYRAARRRDGAAAVVKVLRGFAGASAYARATFLREIELLATLSHPNVVRLFDHGALADGHWFAMEFCDGGSVADRRDAGGPLGAGEADGVMAQLLTGLSYVHARGVVHRDVKPDNVLLADGGARVVLADFGIAKPLALAGRSGVSAADVVVGTAAFMPPEQRRRSRDVRATADVWSAAATYVALRGAWPDGADVARAPLDGIDAPRREVLRRALDDDPARRYADAVAMRAAWREAVANG